MLLVFSILVVVGCSSQSNHKSTKESGNNTPEEGGELVFAYETDVSNYDPIDGSSGADHALLWPVFDTLIKFTPELEAEAGLAQSWEFSDDHTLVLDLRDGVTFHDGTVFDAEAVKFNLDRVNSEESNVSDLENIKSVEVVDSLTVKLHLKEADSSILLALSDRGGMMVSPTALEAGEEFSQNPVGAGPYKMVKRVPNGEINFEAYEEYWDVDKSKLDKITVKIISDENTRINALKSGEVDVAYNISPSNLASLENDPSIKLEQKNSLAFRMIYLNAQMEPFDNKEVRQAIQHGINREELIEAVNFGNGEPAYQPFLKEYWASDSNLTIDYDPEKSKRILQDAGVNNVSFSMIHHSNALESKLAEAIKSQLEKVGIEVNLQPMELTAASGSYFGEKKAPALLSQWTGRPDPQMTVDYLFSEDSFFNTGGAGSPEIESLISEAGKVYDQKDRIELYKEISQKALLEEAIAIPIFFFPQVIASTERVHGDEMNLLGKPILSNMWIEQ